MTKYMQRIEEKTVLVLCATGKIGRNVALALSHRGFKVYGTTRSEKKAATLVEMGIHPIVCDYTNRIDLDSVLSSTGCKRVCMMTDFFGAARKSVNLEIKQGKAIVDACKNAGCSQLIYTSVADAENMDLSKVRHLAAKPTIEKYLLHAGFESAVIARPVAFFENLDDPENWNSLKVVSGRVKFLTDCNVKYCSTYDIGKAIAEFLVYPSVWNGKTVEMASWEGSIKEVAASLQKVTDIPTQGVMIMPRWIRRIFMNDLHHMCMYFEGGYKNSHVDIVNFRKLVPDAMTAEDWFRFNTRKQ